MPPARISVLPGVGGQGRLRSRFVVYPVGYPAGAESQIPTVRDTPSQRFNFRAAMILANRPVSATRVPVLGPEQA